MEMERLFWTNISIFGVGAAMHASWTFFFCSLIGFLAITFYS
jgi:hypothetical protein